jgi:hypothetical protein
MVDFIRVFFVSVYSLKNESKKEGFILSDKKFGQKIKGSTEDVTPLGNPNP